MPTLIVQNGKHKGREFVLPSHPVTIGRDAACDIRLSSARVSRRHCTLEMVKGSLTLTDCGSRNGTRVNSEAVVGTCTLVTGDILQVGPWKFRVAGSHTGVAVKRGLEETSEDEIADWLGAGDSAVPIENETTIVPAARTAERRTFDSVAEEAADIIRRHNESQEKDS